MTKKNIYIVYVLTVCLVAVISLTVMVGAFSYNLFRVAMPHYTVDSYQYRDYIDNDRYIESLKENDRCRSNNQVKCAVLPTSEKEITAQREKKLAQVLEEEKRSAVRSIIENIPYLVLFLLMGWIHWRIFKTTQD